MIMTAANECAKNGITMVHDAGLDFRVVVSLERLIIAKSCVVDRAHFSFPSFLF
jgi:hypothetical protein